MIITLRAIEANPAVCFIKEGLGRLHCPFLYQQRLCCVRVGEFYTSNLYTIKVDSSWFWMILDRWRNILAFSVLAWTHRIRNDAWLFVFTSQNHPEWVKVACFTWTWSLRNDQRLSMKLIEQLLCPIERSFRVIVFNSCHPLKTLQALRLDRVCLCCN